jgi:L-arabinose isomerase
MENLKSLVRMGTRVASQIAFMESYKNLRTWIKKAPKNFFLYKVFPGLSKIIETWGAEGSQAWSFASATENFVENIKDQRIQDFTEEFLESFMDSCTESTMIISYIF